jgi:hypothetical protein
MADYVRYRMAAARLGATMALLALLTNLSDRIASAHASGNSPPVAAAGSAGTFNSLSKLELKLETTLSSLEHKLRSDYTTAQKINTTFLKIKSANAAFLKIEDANTNFLKIDDANTNFLKIDDANNEFLKIDDANNEFLKVGSTASNSSELGGLKPDAFVQGAGSVVSNAVQVEPGNNVDNQIKLISSPDGLLTVTAFDDSGSITLALGNSGSTNLPGVKETNGQVTSFTLPAGESQPVVLGSGVGQSTIQIFPAGASADVITLTVSIDGAGGPIPVVAQMLVGQSTS